MSDDLVKYLRNSKGWPTLGNAAADRIEELEERLKAATDDAKEAEAYAEELEAELHLMKTSGIVEVAVRNPSVMEYMQHWEGRAETAEAKLAKAVEALDESMYFIDIEAEDILKGGGMYRIAKAYAELGALIPLEWADALKRAEELMGKK